MWFFVSKHANYPAKTIVSSRFITVFLPFFSTFWGKILQFHDLGAPTRRESPGAKASWHGDRIWVRHKFGPLHKWEVSIIGGTLKWMVIITLKWMMTGGTPYFRKTPNKGIKTMEFKTQMWATGVEGSRYLYQPNPNQSTGLGKVWTDEASHGLIRNLKIY